jgi:prolyl 4-hydroxylase
MSAQFVTPDLRRWILNQVSEGHGVDLILQAMRASGWSEEVALAAYQSTVNGLDAQAPSLAARASQLPSTVVPEPQLLQGAHEVEVAGHRMQVLTSLHSPRVVVFGGLLTNAECDELVGLAQARLARSETVQVATGASEVNTSRTSEGMFFGRGENTLCARIEDRIAALFDWPLENGEGLQILRYRPGAEYKPHYDYFDPAQPGTPAILKRGGQRVASLVMYLSSPQRGGATVFPDAKLDVSPVKGNAVFFSYDCAHPSTRTLHGGAPVLEGEKWVATKWLRQGRFD